MAAAVNNDRVSELKQQGALEAARDPQSSVTAGDAETKVLEEAKASGAQAFVFDPNASAEEKAQQAKSHIPPELQHIRKHNVAALISDQDDGKTAGYDLPTPTKAGALPVPSSPTAVAAAKQEKREEWDKVGWAPRFGLPGAGEEDEDRTLLDHQDLLEGKLDEKFFGDWYHNTGVIVFASLSSWVVAALGGGLGWVVIIMAVCGTYYRTSIRRVRRNFRDDVHRELAKTRLETDHESLEWMNSFLVKFWPIYAPVLCATIVSSVDQVLSTSTPAFLDSMRMKFFTLGTKPPRLEHVKTYPKAEDDIILMDWRFTFTPNDTADLTAKQIKTKINPKVVLEVRVGKAMVSKGLDIIVEDMAFSGLMRVKMKLQIPFPHIEKVELSFLEQPQIDYVCKPLGGDTFGFDINFIPGLENLIMQQIHANLGPMMYAPNVFPIEIAKILAGNPVDQAIGVLQVTFHGAQGLKNNDKFSGTPDPYATVSINGREVLGKTKTVTENANPRWNETVNIILTSLKDSLTITVFDYNEFRKDKELGQATFALERLEDEPDHENEQLEVVASGRQRGLVQADIRFFRVLEGVKNADGTEEPPPESNTGIAKFTIESAKDLDGSKSMIGQLNPYAVLLLNGKEAHISSKLKRTNNPVWPDATKELLITDRRKAKLGLAVKDEREMSADPVIGTYQIGLTDMLDLMSKGQEWYNLAGVQSGRAKMTLQWKPVAMSGAIGGSGGYVTPIGVMRIHLKSATDLRNVETMGKSDPYARILLSGISKGRTVTFKNNLNPDWDEVIYVPIHTKREKLVIEVMDEENVGKDRSLGSLEIPTADYIIRNAETGEYEVNDSKKEIAALLSQGPRLPPKGTLHHTVSFFPTIPVSDPDEEEKAAPASAVGSPLPTKTSFESTRPGTPSRKSFEPNRARSTTVGTITSLKSTNTAINGTSDLGKKLFEGEKEQDEMSILTTKQTVPKIQLTAEDLSNYESGLLVFKLIDGELGSTGCHLQVVMDDNLFPAYSSAKMRTRVQSFNETGDAMIRELDVSKITLRFVDLADKKGEAEGDHVRAKLTGETISILRQALYKPTQLVLKDKDGRDNKITVSLRFIPVKMKLDPSESVNNQGNLRVEVLDAADLPAADRNGFSDPFCKFSLNGKEVYKTKVQKKTLQPAWNEFFELPIRSRTMADFVVDIYDWDLGGNNDFLGKAHINLDMLEPFQKQELQLKLDGKSGVIRLGMLFKPDYVTKTRQGTSTFSGTFAVPGKIVGAPVKGVGKGATFVGGGVVKGASFLGRGFRGKKDKVGADEAASSGGVTDVPNGDATPVATAAVAAGAATATATTAMTTNGTDSPEMASKELPATPTSRRSRSVAQPTSPSSATETGTATISILSASGYPAGTKVQVTVSHDSARGLKEVLKTKPIKSKTDSGSVSWEDEKHVETKKIPSVAADAQFRVAVHNHSTFGSDEELGEALFYVDDSGAGGGKPVQVGAGTVTIRSTYEAATAGNSAAGLLSAGGKDTDGSSIRSGSVGNSPANAKGGLRKSFMGRRADRAGTPV